MPESIPLSALQHLLYCERQCALIHLEQEWSENRFTAEGRVLHDKAHDGPDESRPGLRIARGLRVQSDFLGLHGICDVVEFHQNGAVIPVEYKRGKPKAHQADEVQLCGQALCLEEMLSTPVSHGFLFYGTPRRRTEVRFTDSLRELVTECAHRLRTLLSTEVLPPASYEKKKCGACSLIETCQPRTPASAKLWFASTLQSEISKLQSEIPTI